MYYTTKKNPIHLVHDVDGIVRTFTGFDQLVAKWKDIWRLDIGDKFKKEWSGETWLQELRRLRRYRDGGWPALYHEYILRDSFGDNIDPNDVRDAYNKKHPYRYRWWYYPGAKRSWRGMFRGIRTFQERKWAHAWDDEEFAPKVRAKRQGKNLPDPWDDYPHRDQDDRCWKRYRKHQWK